MRIDSPKSTQTAPYTLDDLLVELGQRNASDLHLKAGEPPVMRIHGRLYRTERPPLSDQGIKQLIYSILTPNQRARFEEQLELDLAYVVEGYARFRVNVFKQMEKIGAVMRLIPLHASTIDDLGLPQVLKQVAMRPRGLVLVTGPTGSGKTTTLAAMTDYINALVPRHIITIEDPIEFMHLDKMASISQREVGTDTHSFAEALRHVMRQNPDIILVGEMRDLETMALAVTAAETGHLVFSTVHTTDVAQTIDRVIDVFPPQQQQQIRMQLALTLEAVICQTLLPRADGQGRVAAFEIMTVNSAVRALIREGKTHQVYSIVQSSGEEGMVTLDQYLVGLYQRGLVAYEEALMKAGSPRDFEQLARTA
jgi:twitching motility protein PilT